MKPLQGCKHFGKNMTYKGFQVSNGVYLQIRTDDDDPVINVSVPGFLTNKDIKSS